MEEMEAYSLLVVIGTNAILTYITCHGPPTSEK